MCRPYEILEHTADIGLRAHGSTLEEALLNMARGMMALVVPEPERVLAREERKVEAGAASLEGLLVAWLSELVYVVDAERFLPAEIEPPRVVREPAAERQPERWSISARVRGERLDPARHVLGTEIKGVSYHLLKVEELRGVGEGREGEAVGEVQGEDGRARGASWVAQAIFDV